MKHIAILRGINVSGHNKIKMSDLTSIFTQLGCINITTYIQSGNVIFEHENIQQNDLKELIEKAIHTRYHFDVPVIMSTPNNLKRIIDECPFAPVDLNANGTKVLLTLLEQAPEASDIETLLSYVKTPEQLFIMDKHLYLHCPNGYGRSKLSNVFIEKKLKVKATTRNWKTVNKIVALCQ